LLLGDSVVYGIEDLRLFGMSNWIAIGQNSQTTQCLLSEIDWFLEIGFSQIVLYIGGNDADRGIASQVICENVSDIIKKVQNSGLKVGLSEIHGALSTHRSRALVKEINSCYAELASEFDIPLFTSPKELTFFDLETAKELSWDGEHLNNRGNQIWVTHLKDQVNVKFPE